MECSRRVSGFVSLCDRDPSDPERRAVELAQRGRMILDVALADLEESEAALGASHPTTWFFRNALAEAEKAWDGLVVEFGDRAIERALEHPPLAVLTIPIAARRLSMLLILIDGKTYRAEPVDGTVPAPVQWRITRLHPPLEQGPYYVCLLSDGSTQCDCGEWIFRAADPRPGATERPTPCKHLAALAALGWLVKGRQGEWSEP